VGKVRFPGGTPGNRANRSFCGSLPASHCTFDFSPLFPKSPKTGKTAVWEGPGGRPKVPFRTLPKPGGRTPSRTRLLETGLETPKPDPKSRGREGVLPGGKGGIPPPPGKRYHYSRGRPWPGTLPNPGLGGPLADLRKGPIGNRSDLSFPDPHFWRFRETSKSEGRKTEVRSDLT